ncbi:Glucan endo-1,3-beta-glucosidase [Drechslerella dactyloides]|uniref:Glucan endo-1,3-beta-glucosidase n=1 Tax=Drechslerella dactyloides TaxID=74499 RepID=A0AAD6IWN7_DREDA|nr:Glucan endo-1,3-beta-glucosidase [Drechslerella dactyloides]
MVEPSVTNPTDANYKTNWSFMEFTYNHDQLYANISYVDFVGFPIGLSLTTSTGAEKQVLGLSREGPARVADGLVTQQQQDGRKWGDLIVRDDSGRILRILSPNQGMVLNPSLFADYFESYVDDVWSYYRCHKLQIDTQCHFGIISGTVDDTGELLTVDGLEFRKPNTKDIFSASSGPFQTGADAKRNAIIPRLNAELNRHEITNHYARLVHEANVDGRGYAHPYDDVAASAGEDHSGFVNDGAPRRLTIIVGGEVE